MKNFIYTILVLIGAVAFVACKGVAGTNMDVVQGEDIKQIVSLYSVADNTTEMVKMFSPVNVTVPTNADSVEVSFEVGVNVPNDKALTVNIGVDESTIAEVNAANQNKFQVLDKAAVVFPNEITIEPNKTMSAPMVVKFKFNDKMVAGVPYLFTLTIKDIQGKCDKIKTLRDNKTISFIVKKDIEEADVVNKAVHLYRTNYFSLKKLLPYAGNNVTIETFINVKQFRTASDVGEAQISTLCGIEGSTLFRFGDAGLPGNVLQCCGQAMQFPFQKDKWYHIAAVFDSNRNLTMYVNGKEKVKIRGKSATLASAEWFIGRSYSNNRGINALFAEFRIWKTSLTEAEIVNGMYGVDPKDARLISYWKMNKANNDIVEDITGNGHDLILKTQENSAKDDTGVIRTADKKVVVEDLADPIDIDE